MVPPPPALALLMAAIRPAVPPVGPKQGTLIMGAAGGDGHRAGR